VTYSAQDSTGLYSWETKLDSGIAGLDRSRLLSSSVKFCQDDIIL
jgi:hypothetical protein